VLTSLGEKLSDDEMDSLLSNVQVDNNGQVNYEEFVKMVLSG
jgi:calmodulin